MFNQHFHCETGIGLAERLCEGIGVLIEQMHETALDHIKLEAENKPYILGGRGLQ